MDSELSFLWTVMLVAAADYECVDEGVVLLDDADDDEVML
jgi:hypothetical protein